MRQDIPPPPPPPSNHLFHPPDAGPRPTYWLYYSEVGMSGPFTKGEARAVLKQNPGIPYLACREGEEWDEAEVRLAEKKKSGIDGRILTAIIAVIVLISGALWYVKTQRDAHLKQVLLELEQAQKSEREAQAASAKKGG